MTVVVFERLVDLLVVNSLVTELVGGELVVAR